MLLQIYDFICREKIVSTQQLMREFNIDIQALQPMLDLWVRKGAIRKCQENASCHDKCYKCKNPPEYFTRC